jgi:hypothetical protein
MWIGAATCSAERRPGRLSERRRAGGQPSDYGALREHNFLRLPLLADGSEAGSRATGGKRIVNRLVIQVANRAVGFRGVDVGVPYSS